MSDSARLYNYRSLFQSQRLVTKDQLLAVGEISLATLKRDLAKFRDQMGMPIVYDQDRGGYFLDKTDDKTELPGLWFSSEELVSLLNIQRLLEQLEPGLLGAKLKPMKKKLTQLLLEKGLSESDVADRIRIVYAGKRRFETKAFESIAMAILMRKQARIRHFNRQTGENLERVVSPQHMLHYRDNWYVDTWCHLRSGIRSFSVDAIEEVIILSEAAKEVDKEELRRVTQTSYGIFGGQPKAWAVMRFSPKRARWIEGEEWHPEQIATFETDGSYLLKIPYADDRELIGDILRHGPDVQVLEPTELRVKVQKTLLEAASRYAV